MYDFPITFISMREILVALNTSTILKGHRYEAQFQRHLGRMSGSDRKSQKNDKHMNQFLIIIQNSLNKAQAASQRKTEIADVFKEASLAVSHATNGTISLVKEEAIDGFTEGLMKSLALFTAKAEKQTVLLLRHKEHPAISDIQIAFWKENGFGYPCTLSFAKEDHVCRHKNGLISSFQKMLADPHIAVALEKLLRSEKPDGKVLPSESENFPVKPP